MLLLTVAAETQTNNEALKICSVVCLKFFSTVVVWVCPEDLNVRWKNKQSPATYVWWWGGGGGSYDAQGTETYTTVEDGWIT